MRTSAFLLAGILPLLLAAQAVPEAAQNAPLRKAFPRFRLDMGVGFGGTQNAYKRTIDLSQVQDNTPHGPSSFTWPALHVEGEYALTTETSVGLHYDFWQDERWYKISNDMAVHHNTINTWMLTVRQYWNGHDHGVTLYSGLMAGASFEHFYQYKITGLPTTDVTRVALHTTLLGFRFGHKGALATELGVGTKGWASFALSFAW